MCAKDHIIYLKKVEIVIHWTHPQIHGCLVEVFESMDITKVSASLDLAGWIAKQKNSVTKKC